MDRTTSRVIDLGPLSVRAAVGTIDDAARTVEVVFSTGAPVERYDYARGERYLEALSLAPGHVRLERLNAGASVLDTHSSWSVRDILGAVVEDSARLVSKQEGRATLRFSRRPEVDPIWQDVRDGIIRFVSVGYRVYKFVEERAKDAALATRLAVDWEPFEVSLVPMPADVGAKARSGEPIALNPCVVLDRKSVV